MPWSSEAGVMSHFESGWYITVRGTGRKFFDCNKVITALSGHLKALCKPLLGPFGAHFDTSFKSQRWCIVLCTMLFKFLMHVVYCSADTEKLQVNAASCRSLQKHLECLILV